MKLLGAILAGGRSSRFGSDKALAVIGGKPLIAHVAEALSGQCDQLVVCGRDWPGLARVDDWPQPDLGPLGGLCGALRHADANGFDAVLSAGCDVLPVPANLAALLAPGPAYIQDQWLFGLWPAALADRLEQFLATSSLHSIRAWIIECSARSVRFGGEFFNLNTHRDMERLLAAFPRRG